MEKWMRRAAELLSGLVLTSKPKPCVVPYKPQKTDISKSEKRFFKREKPEKMGVSSIRLYRMLAELEAEPRANVHCVLVLKDGVVISEASRPGYSVNVAQLSHSMTKSIIGMAIGFLVDEGKLSVDEKLVDILPEYNYSDPAVQEMTVRHLSPFLSRLLIKLYALSESEALISRSSPFARIRVQSSIFPELKPTAVR